MKSTYNKNFNFRNDEIINIGIQKYMPEDAAEIPKFKNQEDNIEYLQKSFERRTPVIGLAVKRDKDKNLIIDLGNEIIGIIPFEDISINEGERDLNELLSFNKIGSNVYGIIRRIDIDNKEVILSRKESMKYIRSYLYKIFEPKTKVKAVVTNINHKTAYLDLGGEIVGILRQENITQAYTINIYDRMDVGDIVDVAILKVRKDRNGADVTRMELINAGWDKVEEKYSPGEITIGTVKKEKIINGSLFYIVELDENIEAIFRPKNSLKFKIEPKDSVTVSIKRIVPEKNKIEGFILKKLNN